MRALPIIWKRTRIICRRLRFGHAEEAGGGGNRAGLDDQIGIVAHDQVAAGPVRGLQWVHFQIIRNART